MQRIKAAIPNLLTLGNLACGFVAIVLLLQQGNSEFTRAQNNLQWTVLLLMGIAFVCDFLDGFMARLLKVSGPLGKQLDSLADMVTFGILPGVLAYLSLSQLFKDVWIMKTPLEILLSGKGVGTTWKTIFLGISALIPMFSALRLAKFNIDERQTHGFIGLPTPANALFWLGIYLLVTWGGFPASSLSITALDYSPGQSELLKMVSLSLSTGAYSLLLLIPLFSYLLVSPIRLIAFKFKTYGFRENWAKYTLLLVSVVLLVWLTYKALPLLIILYFLLSIIDNLTHQKHEIPRQDQRDAPRRTP
jgi:CDP-diacylglycerol--serine O-phosphatidyltransferase